MLIKFYQHVVSQLLFFHSLAKAYFSHGDDEGLGQLEDMNGQTILRVKRRVWSSFWLFKDLSTYVDSVAIASPSELAVLWFEKLAKIVKLQQNLII